MTDLVETFLVAETALAVERTRWNALTPEERLVRHFDHMLTRAAGDAARALIADAADRHKIEEVAKVYLLLGPEGWEVDSMSYSMALEGYEKGAINEACECDDERECGALTMAANHLQIPDGHELIPMLQRGM